MKCAMIVFCRSLGTVGIGTSFVVLGYLIWSRKRTPFQSPWVSGDKWQRRTLPPDVLFYGLVCPYDGELAFFCWQNSWEKQHKRGKTFQLTIWRVQYTVSLALLFQAWHSSMVELWWGTAAQLMAATKNSHRGKSWENMDLSKVCSLVICFLQLGPPSTRPFYDDLIPPWSSHVSKVHELTIRS